MFTGARKNKRGMDWQLVASYFTVKSTDIFCSAMFRLGRKAFIKNLFIDKANGVCTGQNAYAPVTLKIMI